MFTNTLYKVRKSLGYLKKFRFFPFWVCCLLSWMFYGNVWKQPRSHSFKNCSEVKPERYELIFHSEEPREHVNRPLMEESCDFLNILDLNGSHYDDSFLEVTGSHISFLLYETDD